MWGRLGALTSLWTFVLDSLYYVNLPLKKKSRGSCYATVKERVSFEVKLPECMERAVGLLRAICDGNEGIRTRVSCQALFLVLSS